MTADLRILFVSPFSPFPNDNGGRQRTKLIWEALARLGTVDFVLHSGWNVEPAVLAELEANYRLVQYHKSPEPAGTIFYPLLAVHPHAAHVGAQRYASRRAFYAVRPRAAAAIRALCVSGGYDVVVCRYFRCACTSGLLDVAPLAIDIDDVDWEFFASTAATRELGPLRRWIYRRQARSMQALMEQRLRRVEAAWVAKPGDAGKLGAATRSHLLPNAVDSESPPETSATRRTANTILFVGALGWRPNQNGLRRFVRDVLPAVRARFPEIRLQVVGSGITEDFRNELAHEPGIELVGLVPDVAPYYRTCLFSIVPVDSGAGSHIKIPESLYFGATCVTSRFGHRGYEETLPSGTAVLAADDSAGMVRACLRLIEDPAYRDALATAGLEIVRRLYTKNAFYAHVAASVQQLAANRSGVRLRSAAAGNPGQGNGS